jgi:hypothetical protein
VSRDPAERGRAAGSAVRLTVQATRARLWIGAAEACVFPLSFAQERLWLFEQLYPGTHAYNVPVALRLRGALDAGVLERSLQMLAARHEVLRTTYLDLDGRPLQVIAPGAAVLLARTDLEGQPDAEERARDLATAEARAPFDLFRGPLLRAALYRLDREDTSCSSPRTTSPDGMLAVLAEEAPPTAPPDRPAFAEMPVQYADLAPGSGARSPNGFGRRWHWRSGGAAVPPPAMTGSHRGGRGRLAAGGLNALRSLGQAARLSS